MMQPIMHGAERTSRLRAGSRFLAVWLSSALVSLAAIWTIDRFSDAPLTEAVELSLLLHPFLLSLLLEAWNTAGRRHTDGGTLFAVSVAAAVLAVWLDVVLIMLTRTLAGNPLPQPSPMTLFGPLLLFSSSAFIIGLGGSALGLFVGRGISRLHRR